MAKPKKPPPPKVQFAIVIGDKGALSRMGRNGAMVKKEMRAKDRRRINRMLAESRKMTHQANEHICPID